MKVIVIESGEYEQRGVCAVAADEQAALAYLMRSDTEFFDRHPEHAWQAAKRWQGPIERNDDRVIIKHWDGGETEYTLTPYELEGA